MSGLTALASRPVHSRLHTCQHMIGLLKHAMADLVSIYDLCRRLITAVHVTVQQMGAAFSVKKIVCLFNTWLQIQYIIQCN